MTGGVHNFRAVVIFMTSPRLTPAFSAYRLSRHQSKSAQRLPKDLIWVTTNANVVHNQIKALPIGMTDYCGYSPYHPIIGDTEKFKQHSDDHPRTEKNSSL